MTIHISRDPVSRLFRSLVKKHEFREDECPHCGTSLIFEHALREKSYEGAIMKHFDDHHPEVKKEEHLKLVCNA